MSLSSSQTLTRTASLFLVLFAFSSAFSIAAAQMSFGVVLVCVLILNVRDRWNLSTLLRDPLGMLIVAFVLWQLICDMFGKTPMRSALMLREEWLFLIIPVTASLAGDRRLLHRLVTALACGVIITGIYGIFERFTGTDPIMGHSVHRIGEGIWRSSGFFSYPLTYGNYMATASAFLFVFITIRFREQRGWEKWVIAGGAMIGLIGVFLSNSRGSMLAGAAALLLFGILFWKTRYIVLVLALAGVVGFFTAPKVIDRLTHKMEFDLDAANHNSRLHIWRNSLEVGVENPLLGVGNGNFCDSYYEHVDYPPPEHMAVQHAHNDLLNNLALYGVPGLALFIAIWVVVVRRLTKRSFDPDPMTRAVARAVLIGSLAFFVTSLTEATFADEEVRQLLMFLWGIALVPTIRGIGANNSSKEAT